MSGRMIPWTHINWSHQLCDVPDCCNEPFVFGEIPNGGAGLMLCVIGLVIDRAGLNINCDSPILGRFVIKIPWEELDEWRAKEDFDKMIPTKVPDVFFGGPGTPVLD